MLPGLRKLVQRTDDAERRRFVLRCSFDRAHYGEVFVMDVPMNVKPSLEPYILSC